MSSTKRIVVATIAALASVLTGTAGAAQAATQNYRFTSKGQQAYADFYHESGCIATYASVLAIDGRTQSTGRPSVDSFAYVSVGQADICTSPYTILYHNSGSTELDRDDFQMNMSEATLKANLVLDDNGALPVSVDITWISDGTMSTSTFRYVNKTPDYTSVFRGTGAIRLASAVGTVTADADGTNFSPDPSNNASIVSSGSSTLDIYHN